MFFTIPLANVNSETLITYNRIIIKKNALKTVLMYPMKTSETILDRYFIKNYNVPLKQICLKIVSNAKITLSDKDEIVIVMGNNELDKLASLISYGLGAIPGSNILKKAFGII